MKYLIAILFALALAAPASAARRSVSVQKIVTVNQPQRIVRQKIVVAQPQAIYVPQAFVAPQQLNNGCYGGQQLQQFNAGCQSLYR